MYNLSIKDQAFSQLKFKSRNNPERCRILHADQFLFDLQILHWNLSKVNACFAFVTCVIRNP